MSEPLTDAQVLIQKLSARHAVQLERAAKEVAELVQEIAYLEAYVSQQQARIDELQKEEQ